MKTKSIRTAILVFAMLPILVVAHGSGIDASQVPPAPPLAALASTQDQSMGITINELLPNPSEGDAEWVELYHAAQHVLYMPLILADTPASTASSAALRPQTSDAPTGRGSVKIGGWEIADEDGNTYAIPDALPPVPPGAYVLIYFDGKGKAADDYDFSDGVAVLHTPPGLVDVFEDDADQVALYRGHDHSPETLHDFVAFGAPPGPKAANAESAGLGDASRWLL